MANIIKLPDPQKELAFPLMKAFELRRTRRKWRDEPLSQQDLSNLLWSACGVTMEETKRTKSKRTAPSARNSQCIKILVATGQGLFLYDEKIHSLIGIIEQDVRKYISTQKMMQSAPVGLIYIADYSTLSMYTATDDSRKLFVSGTETGFISQNVYLYCAASGLSTAIIGLVDRDRLHNIIKLEEHEHIVYTQAVGRHI
jgi:SagB-type dehydrogenase family enzyme